MPINGLEKRPIGDQEQMEYADPPVGISNPAGMSTSAGMSIPTATMSNLPKNKDTEAIDQLQEMFPALDRESIAEFYHMCGNNTEKTFELIGQQMNMYGEDGGTSSAPVESNPTQQNQAPPPGLSPEDVEFNMLAGNQFNPNVVSNEERKMIEQALRESEMQER